MEGHFGCNFMEHINVRGGGAGVVTPQSPLRAICQQGDCQQRCDLSATLIARAVTVHGFPVTRRGRLFNLVQLFSKM